MSNDDITRVPDSLKSNLDWYIANQQELSTKYNGKVLLIVNQRLVKAFDDMGGAYAEASAQFAPNTFTLQPCSTDSDSYTLTISNPAFAVFG